MPPVSLTVRPPKGRGAPSQRMFQDESDGEDDFVHSSRSSSRPREERIEGFANGRQVGTKKEKPLVIAPQPNKDWRAAARAAPTYRPEVKREEEVVTHERVGDGPQRRGLRKLTPPPDTKPSAADLEAADSAAASTSTTTPAGEETKPVKDEKEMTLDERALAALIAGEQEEKPDIDDTMVIGLNTNTWEAQSEADALKRDLGGLPDEATLEDYAAVPVEAFGAAILRGMGYDPKNDTEIHVPKSRPALLGLGAKALSSELPPTSHKKKKRPDPATRGGRGFNAANLLVKRDSGTPDSSRGVSRDASPRRIEDGSERRRDASPKRIEDSRRDKERRYETEEERARRKARERERDRDYDRRGDRRDRDRDERRDRDRDDRRDRDRERDRDRRDRDRDDRRDRDRDRRGRDRDDRRDRDRDDRRDRDRSDRRDRDRD